jgi:hypothetical protein
MKSWRYLVPLVGLLLMASGAWFLAILDVSHAASSLDPDSLRRVNAPYDVPGEEAAILWFGRVTPTENSADARVGYTEGWLCVRIAAFDRRLWYDTSPSPDDLVAWDAATLYLDLDGNLGDIPDANAYRFDAQLVWWEPRDAYQAAYQGDGDGWTAASVPFTTTSFWRGEEPNDEGDDRGWAVTFYVPFDSLGLDGPPEEGTVWGMAVALHDRDDAGGTPITDQVWPETMDTGQPGSWGQLAFGLPTYEPPPAIPGATVTIRQGLDGAVVTDGAVGGGTTCGGGLDYWTEWGEANYAGLDYSNIQNLGDIGDWPCFSRYYVVFPLDGLPPGKAIISATLTLHQFGNAGQGWDPPAQPSLIQVLTVAEDWAEATLNWNNAPLAAENVSAAWAYPLDPVPPRPGVPRHWDVSRAVANAYAAGTPLSLALYDSDWAYNSGKYFVTSDADEWEAAGRPTLVVAWGQPVGELTKDAYPGSGNTGAAITYTLRFIGTGNTLLLTDTLPSGISAPGVLALEGTTVTPAYDSARHRLTWSDAVAEGQAVRISYSVTITTGERRMLVNTAELGEPGGQSDSATAAVCANCLRIWLPVIARFR